MLDANPQSIIHYPLISMAQFNRTLGEIPAEFGGGNRYRVIWAPSRKIQRFIAGFAETVQAYGPGGIEPLPQQMTPQHKAGECWILEQWINPYRDCSEEEWNSIPCVRTPGGGVVTRLQAMGPFPRRGYYWRCDNTYLIGDPSLSQVEKMILLVEDGMFRHTDWENFVAIRDKVEKGEKEVDAERDARIRNRFLIGGGEAFSVAGGGRSRVSGRGGGRGTKTINTTYTDRDLNRVGISTKPGAVQAMPRRRKITYDLSPFVK